MSKKFFVPIKGERLDPQKEKDLAKLQFPLFASYKYDGIRALVRRGQLVSYRLKLIPNLYTRKMFEAYEGLDGELTLKSYEKDRSFRKNTSAFMTEDGEPHGIFNVFDIWDKPDVPFWKRQEILAKRIETEYRFYRLRHLEHEEIKDLDALLDFEQDALDLGYEGVVVRSPNGIYKYGRSTIREGYLIKLTRRKREEAEVVDYYERMKNNNVQTRDEHGRAKRSTHKANKVGRGDLGGLVVKSDKYAKVFEIGTGFTDKQRADFWENRDKLLGKIVTFEYSETGDYAVPRNASFIGFRDERDM